MTLTATLPRNQYTATASQTTFDYTFKIVATTELRVWKNGVLLTLGTQYTVTGVGNGTGGTVILTSAATSGDLVVILGSRPLSQDTQYPLSNPFPAAAHEAALDHTVRLTQQLQEAINRVPIFAESQIPPATVTFPHPDASGIPKYLRWNAAGTALETIAQAADVAGLVDDAIPAVTFANLPAPAIVGRLRYVTSGGTVGIYIDTGTAWTLPPNLAEQLQAIAFASLPAAGTPGRLRYVTSGATPGIYLDTGTAWTLSPHTNAIPAVTVATLPAAGQAGRIRYVTDGSPPSIYVDTGTVWALPSALLDTLQVSTLAGLPAAGTTGRVRYVSDGSPPGLRVDTGAAWDLPEAKTPNAIQVSTLAGLGAAATQGRVRAVFEAAKPAGVYVDAGPTINAWVGPTRYDPSLYAGATLSEKITAILATCPLGAIIDCQAFTGTHILTAGITLNKAVILQLGQIGLQHATDTLITVTTTTSEPSGVTIAGVGVQQTFLQATGATNTPISILNDEKCIIRDLQVMGGTTTKTSGQGIFVEGRSGGTFNNRYSVIDNCYIVGNYVGINFNRASGWSVRKCYIVNSRFMGISVANATSPDNGDSDITECIFDEFTGTTNYAIHQVSSGGLRIINNKFLNHHYHYVYSLQGNSPTNNTSIAVVAGNSFEHPATAAISWQAGDAGSSTFSMPLIVGNQFTIGEPSTTGVWAGGNLGSRLFNVCVMANLFQLGSSNDGVLLESCNQAYVAGNFFTGGGGTSRGVVKTSGALNAVRGENAYLGVTTPWVDVPGGGRLHTSAAMVAD